MLLRTLLGLTGGCLILSEMAEARNTGGSSNQETYTNDDFVGLFQNLANTCKGPDLMKCQVRTVEEDNIDEYLLDIDECLEDNSCLSYH